MRYPINYLYVEKKQARLSFEDRLRQDVGDQYAFVAIEAEMKLIPHFDVGKRNMVTAYRFMAALKARLAESPPLSVDDGRVRPLHWRRGARLGG